MRLSKGDPVGTGVESGAGHSSLFLRRSTVWSNGFGLQYRTLRSKHIVILADAY